MNKKNAGFTLIELMVTVVVIGVTLAIAIPSMGNLSRATRITSSTNALVSALNEARGEAVERAEPVSICPSADQATCTGSDDWTPGWISWIDSDADGTVDGGEKLLRVGDGVRRMSIDSGGTTVLTYTFEGTITNAASVTITLEPETCTGNERRRIDVNLSGRPRSSKVSC